MSDDDDDEERGRSKLLYIIIVVVLLLILIIAIVVCVWYFVLGGKGKGGAGDTTTDGAGGERDFRGVDLQAEEKRDADIVWQKLNFTNANKACITGASNSTLMYPRSKTEEDDLMKIFTDKYKAQADSPEKKGCGNDFFIGMRKMVDQEIMTPTGEHFPGPVMVGLGAYSSDYAKQPTIMCYNLQNFKLNKIDCATGPFSCFLCQYECSNKKPFCYKTLTDKSVKNWRTANASCGKAKPPGTLAAVPHRFTLNEIESQLKSQKDACSNPAVGNAFSRKFESVSGFEIPYKSDRVYYSMGGPRTSLMACVVVNIQRDFLFELESCTAEHCYSCFI